MAETKTKTKTEKLPGVAPTVPRHRVLYMRREPGGEFQPVASYQLGDKDAEAQGVYLFDSVRAEHINNARRSAAVLPYFLEQTEENGLKVEG